MLPPRSGTTILATAAASESLAALITETAIPSTSPHDGVITNQQITCPESSAYLRSLTTQTISDLALQPELLKSKADDLDRQLSDLCITQTGAFLSLYHAETSFAPSLSSLSSSIQHLLADSIPKLQHAANAFRQACKPSLDERDRIQNVIEQYERSSLADLLEIPQLVETCVRAGHYAEAIQLGNHIARLVVRSRQSDAAILGNAANPNSTTTAITTKPNQNNTEIGQNPRRHLQVLISLLSETWSHLAKMKMDLIATFSKPGLKLPTANRTALYLRRLHTVALALGPLQYDPRLSLFCSSLPDLCLDESQLCLCFFKARAKSFEISLGQVVSGTVTGIATYLRRYIDVWREEMSETLSIALSLFSASASATTTTTTDEAKLEVTTKPSPTPMYLTSAFASMGLARLRQTLDHCLPQMTLLLPSSSLNGSSAIDTTSTQIQDMAAAFDSLHTQLSYASAALSRFGFDFGQILALPLSHSANSVDHVVSLTASVSNHNDTRIETLKDAANRLNLIDYHWLLTLDHSLQPLLNRFLAELDQANSGTVSSNSVLSDETQQPPRWLPSSWLVSSSSIETLLQMSVSDILHPSQPLSLHRPNIELVTLFPPFTHLLNGILTWFNGIHTFPSLNLSSFLSTLLSNFFDSALFQLFNYAQKIEKSDQLDHFIGLSTLTDSSNNDFLFQDLSVSEQKQQWLEIRHEEEVKIMILAMTVMKRWIVLWSLDALEDGIFDKEMKMTDDLEKKKSSKRIGSLQEVDDWIQTIEQRLKQSKHERIQSARRRKEEKEERLRKEEEEQRQQEEEERKQKEEEERKQKEEEERMQKEEEERKQKVEEERRQQEQLKKEEERKKIEEEERKKKEEEERRLKEQERLKREAEEKRLEEEKRIQQQEEEERKQKEEKRKRQKEEEEKRQQQERLKKEEERKIKEEKERKVKEEEDRKIKKEEDRKQKEEEEEERKQKEEEERKQKEEEDGKKKQEEQERISREEEIEKKKQDNQPKDPNLTNPSCHDDLEKQQEVVVVVRDSETLNNKKIKLAEKLLQRKQQRQAILKQQETVQSETSSPPTPIQQGLVIKETVKNNDEMESEKEEEITKKQVDNQEEEIPEKQIENQEEIKIPEKQVDNQEEEEDQQSTIDSTPSTPTMRNGSNNHSNKKKKKKKK